MKTLIIGLILMFSQASFAEPVAFNNDVLDRLKKDNANQQWLMVLWSVDCPACFKELALIKDLREINPDINVVIINIDGEEEANAQSVNIMDKYQLSDTTTYFFEEGSADRNRYIIDSSWYGELPRSYFVDNTGVFHGKSGLVDASLIKKWLL